MFTNNDFRLHEYVIVGLSHIVQGQEKLKGKVINNGKLHLEIISSGVSYVIPYHWIETVGMDSVF
jgi:ribosome maturation factor RimP